LSDLRYLIGSISPFSIMGAAAFLRQKGLSPDSSGVFHFEHSTPVIAQCEQWLTQVLGLHYLGELGAIEPAAKRVAGRFPFLPAFKSRWRRWGGERLHLNPDAIEHLILPYRPVLADALLCNLFPNAQIHFVADGLSMGFSQTLTLPLYWRLTGIRNPFDGRTQQAIWTLARLGNAMSTLGKPQVVGEEHFNEVITTVCDHEQFRQWVNKNIPAVGDGHFSFLLLQILDSKLVDLKDEAMVWAGIICEELLSHEDTILVKPHPRDYEDKLAQIQFLIPPDEHTRVRFLPLDAIGALPVEIFGKVLPIRSLVGLCSTALLTGDQSGEMQVRAYRSSLLPDSLNEIIDRCAVAGGFPVKSL